MRRVSSIILMSALIPLSTSLASFIIYGVPAFPDSWIHIGIANEAVNSGKLRVWDEYNTNWPIINILLVITAELLGISTIYASVIVLIIAGLTSIPIYLILKKICKNKLLIPLLLTILYMEPTFLTLTSSIQKEVAPLYVSMLIIYITLFKYELLPLIIPFSITIALGHHYFSLYITLLLISITFYTFILELKGFIKYRGRFWLILATIIIALYQVTQGSKYVSFEGIGIGLSDFMLCFSFLGFSMLITYYRGNVISKIAEYLTITAAITFFIYARLGNLFIINLPPLSTLEFIVLTGYIALFLNVLIVRDKYLNVLLIPLIAIALYSLIFEPLYGSLVLLIKALRRAIPTFIILISRKFSKYLAAFMILGMCLAFIMHLSGNPTFGGSALYDYHEVKALVNIAPLLKNITVYGSWRATTIMKEYLGLNAHNIPPFTKVDGVEIILIGDKIRGVSLRAAFEWLPYDTIIINENLIFNYTHLLTYS